MEIQKKVIPLRTSCDKKHKTLLKTKNNHYSLFF